MLGGKATLPIKTATRGSSITRLKLVPPFCLRHIFVVTLPITKRCMEMSFTGHNANHVHDMGYINGSRPTLREIPAVQC